LDIETGQGFFTFQSPWRNIFLWNLMEVEREVWIVSPAIDLDLLRKIQSIMIARSQKKLSIRFVLRFSGSDFMGGKVEASALKILLLLLKEPHSRVEIRFAGNLSSTMAIFDGRKAMIASGDLTRDSMVSKVNYGVLVTGSDMVEGILDDVKDLWEKAAEVPEGEILDYMKGIQEKTLCCEDGSSDPAMPMLAPPIDPLGSDRKEPHLDEERKIVKELLMRARDAFDSGDLNTAMFYLDEAQTLKPDDPDILMEKGKVLHGSGDHKAALEFIEVVLNHNEDSKVAWTYRGLCYEHIGDDGEALHSYDQVTDIDPQAYNAWVRKGIIMGRTKGREEDGLKCLEYALERDPYDEEAWFNKGQILEQKLNRMDEAVLAYRSLLRINPGHVKGSFRLGLISYKKLKDTKRARKYFDAVVASDPGHVHAWMFKGEIAELIEGDVEEALRCYDSARKAKPDSIEILRREIDLLAREGVRERDAYDLANLLLEVSPKDSVGLHMAGIGAFRIDCDPDLALSRLNQAIKADPGNLQAIMAKAVVLSEGLNRPEDALTLLNTALKRNTEDIGLLTGKGNLLFDHLYDPIEALECFNKVTALAPGDADGWYHRGVVLSRGMDQHQEALGSLDQSTRLRDDHHLAWYEKGRILRQHYGRLEDSIKCYRKSIRINDRDPEVLTALASALAATGSDEAERLFRTALKIDPSYLDASIGLADIMFTSGDHEGGQQVLNTALQTDPKSDRLWLRKALAFRDQNETSKAIECVKRSLSFNPGNGDAQSLRIALGGL